MKKTLKRIQVPDGLISNQFQSNEVKVSPKTTYLYVWLKMLLTDYKTYTLLIQPITLRTNMNWKTNGMLKNHLKVLKDLGYITYQDDFDNNSLKPNQLLEIKITKLKSKFKELTEISIREGILKATTEPEKAVRLCYLIKGYTNDGFGYCWLTYEQIYTWGNIRQQDINNVTNQLAKSKLLHVTRGNVIKDTNDVIRKENNKYKLLFN